MSKIVITTDTNSSVTPQLAEELGVKLINMPITIDGVEYIENVDISFEQFMEKLIAGSEVFTSQPTPSDVVNTWKQALKEADYVIHLPMSSALSSTYQTARVLAEEFDGKVRVINSTRISLLTVQAIRDALYMINKGCDIDEVCQMLVDTDDRYSCFLAVYELEHLKRGGRISATAVAVGNLLSIKPVIEITKGKLEVFTKVHGMIKAEKTIIDSLQNALSTKFAGKEVKLNIAYSCTEQEAEKFKAKACVALNVEDIEMLKLPVSICCHTGAGAIGIGAMEVIK